MKVFLAGSCAFRECDEIFRTSPYLLESFVYFQDWQKPLIKTAKQFFLDSGAFTLRKKKQDVSWDEFVERYAKFVTENRIKHYFELDIDNIIGYENVKKITTRLKALTGIDPIPVWHPNRGAAEFEKMCEEYSYVSIGGIAGATLKTRQRYRQLFPWFIRTAHKYGAEIHGLGFTSMKMLEHYHFDSVDSTSWTSGGRFGTLYQFNGRRLETLSTSNRRVADRNIATKHNLVEWIKFQKYAEENL